MNTQETIRISNGTVRHPDRRMAEPINLSFHDGEHIAIVGPNGSGKSLLVDTLTGRYPLLHGGELEYDFSPSPKTTAYENIKYITFRDTYGAADETYYYQQRWNSHDLDHAPLVAELLAPAQNGNGQDPMREELYEMFRMQPLLDKSILLLSSGEMRRFQLIKALLQKPRVLIIDNPYIGLDAPTRTQLTELLTQLAAKGDVQIILVLSMLDDIPPFITHVLPVENRRCGRKITRAEYLQGLQLPDTESVFLPRELRQAILDLPARTDDLAGDPTVGLRKVSIRYGARTILRDLDWTVLQGEKWALSGENGSGKSTLLSLVCADNPQSYACDITLFGRRRGSGESIWEIKRHIGYVSPEMHRAYQKDLPASHIVASGLHDSIGLYVKPKLEQMGTCAFWMNIFGIGDLYDRPFLQLSSGEQRLVLLARAFVKDPELLILDEPLHGLDTYNRARVKEVIQTFCQRPKKTLIMVTHYENELPPCIDHRLYLKKQI